MARKKQSPFLPLDDAIVYVRTHAPTVTTRAEYIRWHKANEPGFLPRYPHRVYDDWDSWNHFLGTTNSFEGKRAELMATAREQWRPFWEAVRYAQQAAKDHNLSTKDQWEEWYDSGMCPNDIPKRPHHAYEEFTGKGWSVWLGTTIKGKVDANSEDIAVMAVCRTPGMPANVVTVVVEGNGLNALIENWNWDMAGKPYRVYRWEKDLIPYVDKVFEVCGSKKDSKVYLIHNIHNLLFELDSLMEYAVAPSKL